MGAKRPIQTPARQPAARLWRRGGQLKQWTNTAGQFHLMGKVVLLWEPFSPRTAAIMASFTRPVSGTFGQGNGDESNSQVLGGGFGSTRHFISLTQL
jgi:hypothetical protein